MTLLDGVLVGDDASGDVQEIFVLFVLRCEGYHLRRDGVSHPGGEFGLKGGEMKVRFT